MKLKDKSHSCPSGAFWKHVDTGTMIHWTETKSWETFYGEIVLFCQRNGFAVPSDEDVQDIVCAQLGAGWCVGAINYQQQAPVQPEGRSGCKTCGGR